MTQATAADWEMAIVLPLGVVANQLRRIEAQLRLLNMKALDLAREHEGRAVRGSIEARLEQINDALGSITGLVSDIEADIQPRSPAGMRARVKDETPPPATHAPGEDVRSVREAAAAPPASRRRAVDQDD